MAVSIAQRAPGYNKHRVLRLLLYVGLGALTFFICFGHRSLDIFNDGWIATGFPEWDITQNYAGWLAYNRADWGWPLTWYPDFCWPEGTVLAYTDSSPLPNLILKLLSPLLPDTFQPFGWYTLIMYSLQGLAAGMLVELYSRRLWHTVPAVLVFTFSPIMMERAFRHVSLTAHFLLLFAVYLYLTMRREGYTRLRWQFLVLNLVSIGLTPYFLPMTFAMMAVAAVEYWQKHHRAHRAAAVLRPLGFIGINAVLTLAGGWLLGVIGWGGATYSRSGYGEFSMNLNAVFNPSSRGGYRWSYLLAEHGQLSGQYDGFNYLGLGVLLFLGLIVLHWLGRENARGGSWLKTTAADAGRFVRRHAPLLVVCACLTAFAITNRVSFTWRFMVEIPLPGALKDLAGIFRASARMFYLPYYLLMLFALRYLLQKSGDRFAALLVTLMAAIQLGDMHGVIGQKHAFFSEEPPYTIVDDPVLNAAAEDCAYLICADTVFDKRLMLLAAKHGLASNMRVVNSGTYPRAKALQDESYAELLSGAPKPGTIYVAADEARKAALWAALQDEPAVELHDAWGLLFVLPAEG